MSFISYGFLLLVLLCLICYYLIDKQHQYLVLLVFSLAFYIISCRQYVVYIIVTAVTTYFAGIYIGNRAEEQRSYLKEHKELSREEKKAYKNRVKSSQKLVMILCLLCNFGILCVIKYADFFIANYNLFILTVFRNSDFVPFFNLLVPLGISFYTFGSMGYIIDLYYGKYDCCRSFCKVALFVGFFPQIVQGPISRFNELSETLFAGRDFDLNNIIYGLYQVLWGLFKKLVIADRVASYVSNSMAAYENTRGIYLLLGIFLYSMQIYGDFSGGIDITIGVSRLFGVIITPNFERPFFSKSVAEYWRRWHITLGTWFKDYIFYPLTVAKWNLKLGKWVRSHINENAGKKLPLYLASFIVWFATGLWHGPEWRYIIWGLLNFVMLTVSTELEGVYEKVNSVLKADSHTRKLFAVVRTFWIMSFLRVFDISQSGCRQALVIIKKAVTDFCMPDMGVIRGFGLEEPELKVAIAGIVIIFAVDLLQRKKGIRDRLMSMPTAARWIITTVFVCFIVIFGSYGMGYDAGSFIYQMF